MYFRLLLICLLFSCATKPSLKPIVMPLTKNELGVDEEETVYTLGYMSDYEIWEFLNERPSEKDVLETFGFPDSVWLDENRSTKYFYYYISKMRDYNTIEISSSTDSVSGFEWD
ncbi:MAG: hypothetical protein ACJZ12_00820 [Candidatus Neomarinimicrobiota bacterium]